MYCMYRHLFKSPSYVRPIHKLKNKIIPIIPPACKLTHQLERNVGLVTSIRYSYRVKSPVNLSDSIKYIQRCFVKGFYYNGNRYIYPKH